MTDWNEIEVARIAAHAKHGDNSIEALAGHDPRWLSVLVEEVGEVAHEQTYDASGDLRAELVDVLSVASAWLDALDRDTDAPRSPAMQRVTEPQVGDVWRAGDRRSNLRVFRILEVRKRADRVKYAVVRAGRDGSGRTSFIALSRFLATGLDTFTLLERDGETTAGRTTTSHD